MTRLREAVAEEKAVLVLQLHQLTRRPPPEIGAASVQTTRQWLHRLERARSVKGDTRASCRQLRDAIESMRRPLGCDPAPAIVEGLS